MAALTACRLGVGAAGGLICQTLSAWCIKPSSSLAAFTIRFLVFLFSFSLPIPGPTVGVDATAVLPRVVHQSQKYLIPTPVLFYSCPPREYALYRCPFSLVLSPITRTKNSPLLSLSLVYERTRPALLFFLHCLRPCLTLARAGS